MVVTVMAGVVVVVEIDVARNPKGEGPKREKKEQNDKTSKKRELQITSTFPKKKKPSS